MLVFIVDDLINHSMVFLFGHTRDPREDRAKSSTTRWANIRLTYFHLKRGVGLKAVSF